jgi:hypothetical protein
VFLNFSNLRIVSSLIQAISPRREKKALHTSPDLLPLSSFAKILHSNRVLFVEYEGAIYLLSFLFLITTREVEEGEAAEMRRSRKEKLKFLD